MSRLAVALVAGLSAACSPSPKKADPDPKGDPPATAPLDARAEPIVSLPPLPTVPRPSLGLPRLPSAHRRIAAETLAIGEMLFSDRAAWGQRMTCADCHQPKHGFSSPTALPKTAKQKTNLRHTPTLYNLGYADVAYWDGRATGEDAIENMLTGHALGQLSADLDEVAVRLATQPKWRAMFARAGDPPTARVLVDALAAYIRTRFSPETPWDRYEAGDSNAVSPAAIRGNQVFNARAGCALCHPPPLYTDSRFHRTALPKDLGPADIGRARVTSSAADDRSFKTPTLRGAPLSPPYFHNGATPTLAEALEHELRRATPRAANLTPTERTDLLEFLQALSPSDVRSP